MIKYVKHTVESFGISTTNYYTMGSLNNSIYFSQFESEKSKIKAQVNLVFKESSFPVYRWPSSHSIFPGLTALVSFSSCKDSNLIMGFYSHDLLASQKTPSPHTIGMTQTQSLTDISFYCTYQTF